MDKNAYKINQSNLTYGRGYVYSLQYHIVWCTKYRWSVLEGEIADDCRKILYRLAEEYSFSIAAMELMPDHVHMLIETKPQFFIPDMVKILKGNTARRLFLDHPELKKRLWGGHLWNPSYCVVTVSERSREQVLQYIETQKEKEWSGRGRPPGKKKHERSGRLPEGCQEQERRRE